MHAFLVSFLSLLLVVVLSPSCSKENSTATSSWSVQLKISGGFTGRGNGNLWLTSDGKFKYEPPAPPNTPGKACEGKLSSEELKPIVEAVKKSQPKQWNRPELKVSAPDAFSYELEFRNEAKAEPVSVLWYDNTIDKLPADLKRLSDALRQAMHTAAAKCPNQ